MNATDRRPERVFTVLAALATLTTAGIGYIAAQDPTADNIAQTAIAAMFTVTAANLARGRRKYRQHYDGTRPATLEDVMDGFFFRLEIAGNMMRAAKDEQAAAQSSHPVQPDLRDAVLDEHGRVIRYGEFTQTCQTNPAQQLR